MLSIQAQTRLFSKFCGTNLRKSIQENFALEDHKYLLNNKTEFSSVIYVDIFDFSKKITGFTTLSVRNYLNEYYSTVMPTINRYGGQIDKIMGDGIIVVFSKIFPEINSDTDATIKSFICCKKIIEDLYITNFEAKTAIGMGNLFFCKTGVEQIYEEYTALGHPMTIAYRLDSIADKNQILLMRNTPLSKRIQNSQEHLQGWRQLETTATLKGIGLANIHVLQY